MKRAGAVPFLALIDVFLLAVIIFSMATGRSAGSGSGGSGDIVIPVTAAERETAAEAELMEEKETAPQTGMTIDVGTAVPEQPAGEQTAAEDLQAFTDVFKSDMRALARRRRGGIKAWTVVDHAHFIAILQIPDADRQFLIFPVTDQYAVLDRVFHKRLQT